MIAAILLALTTPIIDYCNKNDTTGNCSAISLSRASLGSIGNTLDTGIMESYCVNMPDRAYSKDVAILNKVWFDKIVEQLSIGRKDIAFELFKNTLEESKTVKEP